MFLEVEAGHMDLAVWQFVLIIVGVIIAVAIGTFFLVRKLFEKELKKNPPVSEAMIRAMSGMSSPLSACGYPLPS